MDITRHWQTITWLSLLLWPLSLLFTAIAFLRRQLYRIGLLSTYSSTFPVIVVGNITVGGTGKTPLIIAITHYLKENGYSPAVVSRGYGGLEPEEPYQIAETDLARKAGDEPLLIACNTGVPVVVCRQRHKAVSYIAQHTQCDVVLSDDGLQHYAMQRAIEIVSIDGTRGLGNGLRLPAGPLRESQRRLRDADFVISKTPHALCNDVFYIRGDQLKPLVASDQQYTLNNFPEKHIHAVAGIANPDSFFSLLQKNGFVVEEHGFDDHHPFTITDFQFPVEHPIIMTEKDAVKCADIELKNAWYLPVYAQIDNDFLLRLLDKLDALKQ